MNTITLKGKEYEIKVGFGTIRKLERMGINMGNIEAMPIDMLANVIAINTGLTLDEVDEAIDEYVDNGGDFDTISDVVFKAFEESGFFRENKQPQKKTTKKVTATAK